MSKDDQKKEFFYTLDLDSNRQAKNSLKDHGIIANLNIGYSTSRKGVSSSNVIFLDAEQNQNSFSGDKYKNMDNPIKRREDIKNDMKKASDGKLNDNQIKNILSFNQEENRALPNLLLGYEHTRDSKITNVSDYIIHLEKNKAYQTFYVANKKENIMITIERDINDAQKNAKIHVKSNFAIDKDTSYLAEFLKESNALDKKHIKFVVNKSIETEEKINGGKLDFERLISLPNAEEQIKKRYENDPNIVDEMHSNLSNSYKFDDYIKNKFEKIGIEYEKSSENNLEKHKNLLKLELMTQGMLSYQASQKDQVQAFSDLLNVCNSKKDIEVLEERFLNHDPLKNVAIRLNMAKDMGMRNDVSHYNEKNELVTEQKSVSEIVKDAKKHAVVNNILITIDSGIKNKHSPEQLTEDLVKSIKSNVDDIKISDEILKKQCGMLAIDALQKRGEFDKEIADKVSLREKFSNIIDKIVDLVKSVVGMSNNQAIKKDIGIDLGSVKDIFVKNENNRANQNTEQNKNDHSKDNRKENAKLR